jgi:hypothetical protein
MKHPLRKDLVFIDVDRAAADFGDTSASRARDHIPRPLLFRVLDENQCKRTGLSALP